MKDRRSENGWRPAQSASSSPAARSAQPGPVAPLARIRQRSLPSRSRARSLLPAAIAAATEQQPQPDALPARIRTYPPPPSRDEPDDRSTHTTIRSRRSQQELHRCPVRAMGPGLIRSKVSTMSMNSSEFVGFRTSTAPHGLSPLCQANNHRHHRFATRPAHVSKPRQSSRAPKADIIRPHPQPFRRCRYRTPPQRPCEVHARVLWTSARTPAR